MQQLSARVSMGWLLGLATVGLVLALARPPAVHDVRIPHSSSCGMVRPCAGSLDALIAARRFDTAALVFELQRRPDCAQSARELAIVYHVAMAPNTDAMEAFVAAQHALRIENMFGTRLLPELSAQRRALAPAATRAFEAHGLADWARESRLIVGER